MTVKNDIITFAASKLLGGIDPARALETSSELPHRLACLAQRLPIEFLSTSYSLSLADPQNVQVRSHLCVVIRVIDDLETMVTASPSNLSCLKLPIGSCPLHLSKQLMRSRAS